MPRGGALRGRGSARGATTAAAVVAAEHDKQPQEAAEQNEEQQQQQQQPAPVDINANNNNSSNKRLNMHKIFGTAPSPDPARHPEAHAAFQAWCKSMGIFLHPSIQCVDIPNMGRGVVATAPLAKGTIVMLVPQRALLTPNDPVTGHEAHRNSPVVAAMNDALRKSLRPKVTNFTRVVLRFMSEVARRRGPWAHWIALLPVMPSALWRAVREQPELVAGTDVGHALSDLDVLGQWEQVKDFVLSQEQSFPPPLNTLQLFLQCASQVASRNFHIEHHESDAEAVDGPFLKMLPVIDFVNHSRANVNVVLRMHGGRGRAPLQIQMETVQDITTPGQQLLFSYSDMSSGRFLAEFGFVPLDRWSSVAANAATENGSSSNNSNSVISRGVDSIRISHEQLIAFCSAAAKLDPRDLEVRLHQLDNANLVYREGVFVPHLKPNEAQQQQQQSSESSTKDAAKKKPAETCLADELERQKEEQRPLTEQQEVWNTIALLTLDKKAFDELFPVLHKWWRCDPKQQQPQLKDNVRAVLTQRKQAAMRCAAECEKLLASLNKVDKTTTTTTTSNTTASNNSQHHEDALNPSLLKELIAQYAREGKIVDDFLAVDLASS